jgi:hypothetical protein
VAKRIPRYSRGQSVFHRADAAHGVIDEIYEQLGAHGYYVYFVSWDSSEAATLVKEHLLSGSVTELDASAMEADEPSEPESDA